jgi:hypothetical protein
MRSSLKDKFSLQTDLGIDVSTVYKGVQIKAKG